MEQSARLSPRGQGRLIGAVYMLFFVTTVLSEVFMEQAGGGLRVVSADAAATASKILANEAFYRLGIAIGIASFLCYVTVAVLFYRLFKPVNPTVSLLATCIILIGLGIQVAATVFLIAPLVILRGGQMANAFDAHQLQTMSLLSLNLYEQANRIALVFYGLFWLAIGYLIVQSAFLPRALGILFGVAGLGYLVVLAPPLANVAFTYVGIFATLVEVGLIIWLLVKGVDSKRWNERNVKPVLLSTREPALTDSDVERRLAQ